MVQGWQHSYEKTNTIGTKRVYYMSLEFLIGRLMFDALTNLGLMEPMREALSELGVDLDALRQMEPDAALGNGGLGRLAACFMESMATLAVPAYGYGIRYENGLFRQVVKDGWQQEYPENWLSFGNPWEFARPEIAYDIGFGGSIETVGGDTDKPRYVWHPAETVEAVAYDTPVVGWRGKHVNTLRLWSARAGDPCVSMPSTRATISGLWRIECGPKRSRRFFIRPTPRRPVRSCASGKNTSLPQPPCRISSAGISRSFRAYATFRTRPRSS